MNAATWILILALIVVLIGLGLAIKIVKRGQPAAC